MLSGRLITRTGKYKILRSSELVWPIGLYMLSQGGTDTSYWMLGLAIFILGAGLGNVMQVLIIAVQNNVDARRSEQRQAHRRSSDRSAVRSGTAVFGAVWTAQLAAQLAIEEVPGLPTQGKVGTKLTSSIDSITSLLKAAIQEHVLTAMANAIDNTFLFAVPFAAFAFLLSFFLKEVPLRKRQDLAQAVPDDAAVRWVSRSSSRWPADQILAP